MVRFKARWVLAEIFLDVESPTRKTKMHQAISSQDILQAVRDVVDENFGNFGAGKLGRLLKLECYRPSIGIFVIQCGAAHVKTLITSLFFLTTIGKQPLTIRILHTGGTLLNTKLALQHYLTDWYIEARLNLNYEKHLTSTEITDKVYVKEKIAINQLGAPSNTLKDTISMKEE